MVEDRSAASSGIEGLDAPDHEERVVDWRTEARLRRAREWEERWGDTVRAQVASGVSMADIAEAIEQPLRSVRRFLAESGIRPRRAKTAVLAERDARMAEMWVAGKSFPEIGAEFGVSRQRVEQIIGPLGLTRDVTPGELRRQEDRRATAAFEAEYGDRIRQLALVHSSIVGVAAELPDAPEDRVFQYFREHDLRCHGSRIRQKRYSDEELLEAIAAASDGRTSLTGMEYQAWAAKTGGPSLPTIHTRLGSWNAALRRLGMDVNERPTVTYENYWSEERCIEVVRRWMVDSGSDTAPAFGQFGAGRDDVPSVATVRNRLGGWTRAVNAARWWQALIDEGLASLDEVDLSPRRVIEGQSAAVRAARTK